MKVRAIILNPLLLGIFLAISPSQSWSQVYNEEQKRTFIYPISDGWNMMSQDLKRQYMGNSVLPNGIQIGNIISANIQIKNDLNGAGTSTFSSRLYRLNDATHGTLNSGGQFHIKCDNYPQCEAYMYGFKGEFSGSTFFTNSNYDSYTNPRGFIKMEYLNTGTTSNPGEANDYYFPIGAWDMHTNLNTSKTRNVTMAGININNIASISASVYSDPVNNNIEVRDFEQRGKADFPNSSPGLIFRGGLLHVSNVGPTATLKVLGTPSLFSQLNGNYNSSMFSHGGYTQTGTNRGWIKVTVSGSSDAKQPYAIKSKFMQIGGWPIRTDNVTTQAHKDLTFSSLGVPANRIVHAEALILSDPEPGSSSQVRKLTNIMRLNMQGQANISPDGGLFIIQQALNRVRLVALGQPGQGHYFGTEHSNPSINRGWFLVDYLAAQCNEGSGYTRSFIGFTSNSDDCHGNNGSGSAAIHVIQTKAADLWNNNDQIAFINKPQTAANFTIQARVDKIENTNSWAKAGVMIRAGLGQDSRHVSMVVTPRNANGSTNGIDFTIRSGDGNSTTKTNMGGLSAPYWVRIVKTGNSFSGYVSANGSSWVPVGQAVSVNFPTNGGTYYAGLTQTAGNISGTTLHNTSVYSNVSEIAGSGGGGPQTGVPYSVKYVHSGKCLGVVNGSTANAANVEQQTCTGANHQKLTLNQESGGHYSLRFQHGNQQMLDINGASTANGASALQWPYHGNDNQLFELVNHNNGTYSFKYKHSQRCVDVNGAQTSDGANVIQWDCHYNANQRFTFE